MPAITLNSLQFPGLSDTYKIPPQAIEFSSTETYAEGTYVTYQGQLYKCTVAVTTAGDWTGSTNWTQINIGDAVENLTNDLSSKAPAGFGLGVQLNTLTAILDANDIDKTGWFCTVSTTSNLPSNRDTSYAGVIESVVRGTTYMYQRYYDYHAAKIFERIKNENGWNEWIQVHSDTSRVPVYGLGENLLRNWYFLNPVNQREVTSVTQRNVFTVDAWKTRDASYPGSVSVTQNGLVVVSSNNTGEWVEQKIPSTGLVGKSLTLSALTPDGLFTGIVAAFPSTGTALSVATSNGTVVCGWSGENLVVSCGAAVTKTETYIAVKLELGTEQTLAHLEGSTWILNEIPNYEEELIKCQTSTADSADTYANKTLATEQQLAYVETGSTASRNYTDGKYVCWRGKLYRTKTTISSGTTFNASTNGNCEEVTDGGINNSVIPKSTTNYTLSNSVSVATIQTSETTCQKIGGILLFYISFKAGATAIASGSVFADLTVDSCSMVMVSGVSGSTIITGARLGQTRVVLKSIGSTIAANDTFSCNMMLVLS